MSELTPQWRLPPPPPPAAFIQTVTEILGGKPCARTAALLWQRGICTSVAIAAFIHPAQYPATSPAAFGEAMQQAVERLQLAQQRQEKILIWGDFDTDGLTATAVLWEGLGRLFPQGKQLGYYIPHRFTESHGLSYSGLDRAKAEGYDLIVTCDTGCSQIPELLYAQSLGLQVIVTDHHTLPPSPPPAEAVINPRQLPDGHPLAHLSGVAVAYKLLEALYPAVGLELTDLEPLLDLVAIGLIADLVQLTGECRYLAQLGLQRLSQLKPPSRRQPATSATQRPGLTALLENCKRTGDRPTDISFGLAPRINAVSRIHGDARFVIDLLTSSDPQHCKKLADEAELANTRRKGLQQQVLQDVKAQLRDLDLSSQPMIVLYEAQWPIGILGLVAGQIAQEYSRPTLLLTAASGETETEMDADVAMAVAPSAADALDQQIARGSARSIPGVDLYQLVASQEHLLLGHGGHPLALGMSLAVANIPLLREALNRQLKTQATALPPPVLQGDLTVTVADLCLDGGQSLFRELKPLEPFGMGNPVPRLFVTNCWFQQQRQTWNITDLRHQKTQYIHTDFELWDDTCSQGFPGIWWGHGKAELPAERCDVLVELDFQPKPTSSYKLRLIAVRAHARQDTAASGGTGTLLDWRGGQTGQGGNSPTFSTGEDLQVPITSASTSRSEAVALPPDPRPNPAVLKHCPTHWNDFLTWHHQVRDSDLPLAIAFTPPPPRSPREVWTTLLGLAKYLSRTQETVSRDRLEKILEVCDRTLDVGLESLELLGYQVTNLVNHPERAQLQIRAGDIDTANLAAAASLFMQAVQEEAFRRQYFAHVPVTVLEQALTFNSQVLN